MSVSFHNLLVIRLDVRIGSNLPRKLLTANQNRECATVLSDEFIEKGAASLNTITEWTVRFGGDMLPGFPVMNHAVVDKETRFVHFHFTVSSSCILQPCVMTSQKPLASEHASAFFSTSRDALMAMLSCRSTAALWLYHPTLT